MKRDSSIALPDFCKLDKYVSRIERDNYVGLKELQLIPQKTGMWNTVTGWCLNWMHIEAASRLIMSILPSLTLFNANKIYNIYNQKGPMEGDFNDQSLFNGGNHYGADHICKNAKRDNLYLLKAEKEEKSYGMEGPCNE